MTSVEIARQISTGCALERPAPRRPVAGIALAIAIGISIAAVLAAWWSA